MFTLADIEHCALPAVISAGRFLVQENSFSCVQIGLDCGIALVSDTANQYRVCIGFDNHESLWYGCSCGFSQGACSHVAGLVIIATEWDGPLWDEKDAASEALMIAGIVDKPIARLYLTEHDGQLFIHMRYAYASCEFARTDTCRQRLLPDIDSPGFVQIRRSRAREDGLVALLTQHQVEQYQSGTYLSKGDVREWLQAQVPFLAEAGFEIYGLENLKTFKVHTQKPTLTAAVSSTDEGIKVSLNLSVNGISALLSELIGSINEKRQYVRLIDGSITELPVEWIEQFALLVEQAQCKQGFLLLPDSALPAVAALNDIADDIDIDPVLDVRRNSLKNLSQQCITEAPEGFRGTLRSYQAEGLSWFLRLSSLNLGGCLADDMGLGKTIQTIAFLLTKKCEGASPKTSMVVAPVSVLHNWQQECHHFAPTLLTVIYHGDGRMRHVENLHTADIIITSYSTCIRDAHILSNIPLNALILDEAQTIKNPASRAAHALRSIPANFRLALSGTPVENRLTDLWSLFSFINPGLLGSFRFFKEKYADAIERDGNKNSASMLRGVIAPFILRRTKAQVAIDLPPKTESIIETPMLPRQKIFYDITRDAYRTRIMGEIDRNGMSGAYSLVFEGLLRLRQICCHPILVDSTYVGESGKFRMLAEQIEKIRQNNHRVLVFSQFVKALHLVAGSLSQEHIGYELLTGETKDRAGMVSRFQKAGNELPVFLISLRAGGVGLNLTAADYVIHLDPWWNPAAEEQASDRSHRIGQKNNVFVYRYITPESVEERVRLLQERKRELIRFVLGHEVGTSRKISKDEVDELFKP